MRINAGAAKFIQIPCLKGMLTSSARATISVLTDNSNIERLADLLLQQIPAERRTQEGVAFQDLDLSREGFDEHFKILSGLLGLAFIELDGKVALTAAHALGIPSVSTKREAGIIPARALILAQTPEITRVLPPEELANVIDEDLIRDDPRFQTAAMFLFRDPARFGNERALSNLLNIAYFTTPYCIAKLITHMCSEDKEQLDKLFFNKLGELKAADLNQKRNGLEWFIGLFLALSSKLAASILLDFYQKGDGRRFLAESIFNRAGRQVDDYGSTMNWYDGCEEILVEIEELSAEASASLRIVFRQEREPRAANQPKDLPPIFFDNGKALYPVIITKNRTWPDTDLREYNAAAQIILPFYRDGGYTKGKIIVCGKGADVCAIESIEMEKPDKIRWKHNFAGWGTIHKMAVYREYLFLIVGGENKICCLDLRDGKTQWSGNLPPFARLAGDDRILFKENLMFVVTDFIRKEDEDRRNISVQTVEIQGGEKIWCYEKGLFSNLSFGRFDLKSADFSWWGGNLAIKVVNSNTSKTCKIILRRSDGHRLEYKLK